MKLFLHVLYSWLLAIAITLAGLFIYEVAENYIHLDGYIFDPELLFVPPVALFAALPSLLLAVLFFLFIRVTGYTVTGKFLLWYIAALSAVTLNILLILLLVNPWWIEPAFFLRLWPAYVAVIIAVSIRCRQFALLLHEPATGEKITSDVL